MNCKTSYFFVAPCIPLRNCAAGAKVTDTIRKGIIDIEPYENATELLMVGNVAALTGSVICSFFAQDILIFFVRD